MLTKEETEVLLVLRILAAHDSCNSYHINHVEGQIRALTAVLTGGESPPTGSDTIVYLDAVGIPWGPHPDSPDGGGWNIEEQWFLDRGCEFEDGRITHPKFGSW